ncbi:MAG: sporulation integral membrane protein YtvI [Lachnospiraceae bacterium]|nr:sporulation integral membrane protein YtvI [Lachnospiraceae bacterium]
MKPSTKYLKITVNILTMALAVAFCIFVLPKIIVYFMPFVIAGIIAMIANPVVRFLEQKLKIVRKAGSVFVIIIVLGLVVFVCYAVIAKLITETIGFFDNFPKAWSAISSAAASLRNDMVVLFKRMPDGVQVWLDGVGEKATEDVTRWISSLSEPLGSAAGKLATNLPLLIISVIMTILASYLFVAERDYLEKLIKRVVPKRILNRLDLVVSTMKSAVGGYFKAQFKIMIFVYAVLLVGLVILGVEYAFLIALLIAVLDFLPFFGTGAVMWPWALIALLQTDYKMAVGLMIIWGVSQLVRQLIQPKMVGDSIGMEPIPTLIFLYVGFRVGGAVGIILAVPVGMIIINLYKAGVFRNFVYSIQLLLKDIGMLRRFDRADLVREGVMTQEEKDALDQAEAAILEEERKEAEQQEQEEAKTKS